MEAYKETIITMNDPFPVEIFISDNEKSPILVEPHWHDCIEILCVLEGTAKQLVNDQTFYMEAHDVLVITKGDIHCTWCEKDAACKILVLKFMPELIQNSSSIHDSKYIYSFLQSKNKQLYFFKNMAQENSNIYQLFMGVIQENEKKALAHQVFIKGYIYQIIAIFLRNGTLNFYQNSLSEEDYECITPLISYIEKHYDENITLDQAANMVNMSYYHFSRYFKKVTGRNFKEYIDFVRINEADQRLVSSDKSISEVAYEVGYNNLSSFNRVYKRIRGYSPSMIKRAKSEKF